MVSTSISGKEMEAEGIAKDDLKREIMFHEEATKAVAEAHRRLRESKIPFQRPKDYYAEMLKSDDHMQRVKSELIQEKERILAVDQRRKAQSNKKMQKEIQENKRRERAEKKKRMLKKVEAWRSKHKKGEDFQVGLMMDMEDDDGGRNTAPRRQRGAQQRRQHTGGKSKKRRAADEKFGFGPKRSKRNDAESTNDMNWRRGRGSGGRKNGGGKRSKKNRPGKHRRQQQRGSRK